MTRSLIRVLIVDDEPLARRGIRQLLSAQEDVEIAGEARNGREAIRMVQALAPDLMFLDVQMPEFDGFDVLRNVERIPMVIFVTAYDTFAVRAFEERALDYLVKPIGEARFHDAMARARERLQSEEAIARSRRMLQEMKTHAPARRVIIGSAGSDIVLDVAEIAWIEADDYYAIVHAGGRRHLLRESLASLERRLDRRQFIRAHRRAIVNLAEVREIRGASDGESTLILKDGSQLPLSRRRRQVVENAMRHFAAG